VSGLITQQLTVGLKFLFFSSRLIYSRENNDLLPDLKNNFKIKYSVLLYRIIKTQKKYAAYSSRKTEAKAAHFSLNNQQAQFS